MILELPEKLLAKLEELSKAERRTLEELIAEDQVILSHKKELEKKYGIRIYNYQNLLQQT